MKPLIFPASQFDPLTFRQYDKSFTFQCADLDRLNTYIEAGRRDVVTSCKDAAKLARPDDDGIPKAPAWGPVVIGEQTAVTEHVDVTQHYRLIPDGFQGRVGFESTDGKEARDFAPRERSQEQPPPLPTQADVDSVVNQGVINREIGERWLQSSEVRREPIRQGKLYRVDYIHGSCPVVSSGTHTAPHAALTEVTLDEVAEDMRLSKLATYIRGEIVTPKLRVEL